MALATISKHVTELFEAIEAKAAGGAAREAQPKASTSKGPDA